MPFLGEGTFAFGRPHDEAGAMRCIAGRPALATAAADLSLFGESVRLASEASRHGLWLLIAPRSVALAP